MFKKPFSVKSNSSVKSSDCKKLLSRWPPTIRDALPSTSLSIARLSLQSGGETNVYLSEREPVMFEVHNELLPTIYLGWLSPSVAATLLINAEVFNFIKKGADLMLPGVYVLSTHIFPQFGRFDPVLVCVYTPKTGEVSGAIAVGTAQMSSKECIASGMKGKGVQILHTIHDKLWEYGSKKTTPTFTLDDVYTRKDASDTEFPMATPKNEQQAAVKSEQSQADNVSDDVQILEPQPEESKEENAEPNKEEIDMDELLLKTLLLTLKEDGESLKLPMDVGQFYASKLLRRLPEGIKLDLKKTKAKKFTTFLKMFEKEQPDVVKTVSKRGVDMLTEVNVNHELVRTATTVDGATPSASTGPTPIHSSRVSECFSITEAVMPLLGGLGFRKGDILQPNELRDLVVAYSQSNKLLLDGQVELDDTLQTAIRCFVPCKYKLNELVQKIGAQMTKCWVVTLQDKRQIVRKLKAPSIVFLVERRSGNKTVTLVNNVVCFGIDAKALCQTLRSSLATGATINDEVANCEGPQILINGNQVATVGEMLQSEYKIQKQYIKGLELGVKPQKKKGKR